MRSSSHLHERDGASQVSALGPPSQGGSSAATPSDDTSWVAGDHLQSLLDQEDWFSICDSNTESIDEVAGRWGRDIDTGGPPAGHGSSSSAYIRLGCADTSSWFEGSGPEANGTNEPDFGDAPLGHQRRDWDTLGTEPGMDLTDAQRWELEYNIRNRQQIEECLADIGRRAALNTNIYLDNGQTPHPLAAAFIARRNYTRQRSQNAEGEDNQEQEEGSAWSYSILLQRWVYQDKATGAVLIYPMSL